MKITVIGGAGVRAPLLVGSIAKRQSAIDIDELAIYDIDPRKVELILPLARHLLEKAGSPFKLTLHDNPADAIRGAGAVITTIREGFEIGRARDERMCLDAGTIGQETTGAAGFAFACRSVPALIDYARLTFDLNPEAWLLNFTNPAGLATEALNRAGFDRVIGICDSADTGRDYAADHLGITKAEIDTRVAGLNHCSFTTSITHKGKAVLPDLLKDPAFLHKAQPIFPAALPAELGCYLNEYLYYYFLPDEALTAMQDEPKCRGELVAEWNAGLLSNIEPAIARKHVGDALDDYLAYVRKRNESYMEYAREEVRYLPTDDEEGYAGVALDFLEAIASGSTRRHVFCVPNRGAISALSDNDVVEITCDIGNNTITPIPNTDLSPRALDVIRSVKRYENLAVEAIAARSREAAEAALVANPLVADPSAGSRLMDGFMNANPHYFEDWT